MTYDGRAVANKILDIAASEKLKLSNLALQKIMFFCHAWHLVETGNPLVKQEFEAWQHGPVLQYIYRQFAQFEKNYITARAKGLNTITGEQEEVNADFDNETLDRMARIVRFYGKLEPWELVELSHKKDGPWDKVWNHSSKVNPGMKISHESIKEFYSSLNAKGTLQ